MMRSRASVTTRMHGWRSSPVRDGPFAQAGISVTELGPRGSSPGTFWEKPTLNSFESGWEIFKPVIAAVNGYCLGYGLTLATWCDFVLASDRAEFGLPEVNLGVPGHRGVDTPAATPQLGRCDGAAAHRGAHRG